MIARMWRGWVRTEKAVEYVDIVERTGMAGYRRTPGNAGAQLLTRDLGGGRTEVITLSWWSSLDDIRAFAGDDIEKAKYYPEDDEYLLDREHAVQHFEVAPPHQAPGSGDSGGHLAADANGFVFTRVLAARRADVFAHFTQAEAFSRWFVVGGFTTPAERLQLDPRPGGSISGVMVSEQDGTELPFTAGYGAMEAPRLVEFVFTEPAESVTITLQDLGEAGTQLTYHNQGSPPAGRAEAIVAAEAMIDALADSLKAGSR
jgi:uncharacterized protein YndB with AHSA1/START domain/heme-degrading monooxygenase HmoA